MFLLDKHNLNAYFSGLLIWLYQHVHLKVWSKLNIHCFIDRKLCLRRKVAMSQASTLYFSVLYNWQAIEHFLLCHVGNVLEGPELV